MKINLFEKYYSNMESVHFKIDLLELSRLEYYIIYSNVFKRYVSTVPRSNSKYIRTK